MKSHRATRKKIPWWTLDLKAIRFCTACGQKLVTRFIEAEQCRRRICSGCGLISYANPKVVAGLIPVMPNGDIVLLQRSNDPAAGRWSYPAGYQEMGETVARAAEREAEEEVCLKIRAQSLVGIYSYPDAGVVTVVYHGRVGGKQIPTPGHEARAVKIFSPSNIPWGELAFRSTRDAFRDWKKLIKRK